VPEIALETVNAAYCINCKNEADTPTIDVTTED
jgi:hypothetical protein